MADGPGPDTSRSAAQSAPEAFQLPLVVWSPSAPVVTSFRTRIEAEDSRVQVHDASSAAQALEILTSLGGGVLVFSAVDDRELVPLTEVLKGVRGMLNFRLLTIIVLTASRSRQILDRLQKVGVSEIWPYDVPAKAFGFKMKRILDRMARTLLAKLEPRETAGVGEVAERTPRLQMAMEPEMSHVPECWLLSRGGAKRVLGRIELKMAGPSEVLGTWKRLSSEAGPQTPPKDSRDQYWEWVPDTIRGQEFGLGRGDGTWIFEGERPELQGRVWVFSGRNPELSYWYGSELWAKKFWMVDGQTVAMRKDPAQSEEILREIQESMTLSTRLQVADLRQRGAIDEAERLERESRLQSTLEASDWDAESEPPVDPVALGEPVVTPTPDPEPVPRRARSVMAEEAEAAQKTARIDAVKAAMSHVRKHLGMADSFRKARERKAAQGTHVPGQAFEPFFKPLSLAVLFSEILSNPMIEEGDRANRCARLLTESIEGSVFELWVSGPSGWTCVGATGGKIASAQGLEFLSVATSDEAETVSGAAVVIPVEGRRAAWVAIGLSAIDVPREYWVALARISKEFGALLTSSSHASFPAEAPRPDTGP